MALHGTKYLSRNMSRNTGRNAISEQYALGYDEGELAKIRVASANVRSPKFLKAGSKITSRGQTGVVISTQDRYRLGV